MIDRQVKNEKGFTLIEMLLAMALGLVILGGAMYTYTQQDQLLRDENTNLQLRDSARLAMDDIVPNIRLAGLGFPPGDSGAGRPALGITNADVTTFTFRANTEDVKLYAARDSAALSTGITVPLNSAFTAPTIFLVDDTVVYFDVNAPASWRQGPVAVVINNFDWGDVPPATYDVIGLGSANNFPLNPISSGVPAVVNKFHTFTYTFNSGPQTITFTDDQGTAAVGDDTTTTIATNVAGLVFRYFDQDGVEILPAALPLTDPDDSTGLTQEIRKVQVSITTTDPVHADQTTTLVTDIHLRNMGL